MADYLKLEVFPPPVNGLDTTSNAGSMPEGFAPALRNFLVHRTGLLPIRGPIADDNPLEIGDHSMIAGAWVFGDKMLVALQDPDATRVKEPWWLPSSMASADTELTQPSNTMKLVDLTANTVTDVGGNIDLTDTIGGRGAQLGDATYGFAYASDTSSSNTGVGTYWVRSLLSWDGTSTVPTKLANAPQSGADVITHLNRIWVLGGINIPGGDAVTELSLNSLYFSDLFGPVADTAAEWEDNASGLVNQIVVDSDDPRDYGVGLAKAGDNLVIFKRNSVHVLYGYSPATFNLKPLTRELGCVDRRSIVEYGGAVYWLSAQGFHRWDGENLENLHRSVEATMLPAISQTVGEARQDGGRVVATKLAGEYLLLSICRQEVDTGMQVDDSSRFSAMLHVPTGRWTEFSTEALDAVSPVGCGLTANQHYITDGTWVVRVPYLTDPEVADESDRGLDRIDSGTDARTNLCTNPEFETDTTGWTVSGAASSARTEIDPPAPDPGDPVGFPIAPVSVDWGLALQTDAAHLAPYAEFQLAVTSGLTYTFSYYFVQTDDNVPCSTYLTVHNNAGTEKDRSTVANVAPSWRRRRVTFTADSTETWKFRVHFEQDPPSPTAEQYVQPMFSGVLIENTHYLKPYINGTQDAAAGRLARIPAYIEYPLFELDTPQYMSQMHRIFIDYSFLADELGDDAIDAWYVTLLGGDGRIVKGEFRLPSMGNDPAYLSRRRYVKDCFKETPDAQLRIEWRPDEDDSTEFPALVKAELYNAFIEYIPGRQRRST